MGFCLTFTNRFDMQCFMLAKIKNLFFSLTFIARYFQSHEKYVFEYFLFTLLLWQKSESHKRIVLRNRSDFVSSTTLYVKASSYSP